MSKYIGVADLNLLSNECAVKKAALICDHLSFSAYHLSQALNKLFDGMFSPLFDDLFNKIETLKSKGIVIDAPSEFGSENTLHAALELVLFDKNPKIKAFRDKVIENIEKDENIDVISRARMARRAAMRLQQVTGWDTVVIDTLDVKQPALLNSGVDSVLSMLMTNMPEPSSETPWEAIVEYRQDADAKRQYAALKHWVNSAISSNKSIKELEDEMVYLQNEYKEHMRIHHMKIELGTMETVVVASAEILENLVRLKFGKAVKAIFAIEKRKVELLDAERQAPGRQLAYIINTVERFSSNA